MAKTKIGGMTLRELFLGLLALAISIGLFFLFSYFLQLSYNATLPQLLDSANVVDNYWVFVIFSIFLAIAGFMWSPFAGVFGGLVNRPRLMRKMGMKK